VRGSRGHLLPQQSQPPSLFFFYIFQMMLTCHFMTWQANCAICISVAILLGRTWLSVIKFNGSEVEGII
jgi:hypothetical protein